MLGPGVVDAGSSSFRTQFKGVPGSSLLGTLGYTLWNSLASAVRA